MRKLLIFFAAGCLGALANSLTVWFFGDLGITRSAGVSITPSLSAAWLYPRIVWGGIWGLAFVFPVYQSRALLKGAVLSLLPTAAQLLIIYPYKTRYGFGGLGLGFYTPLFVAFFNWVWGVTTALTIKYAR